MSNFHRLQPPNQPPADDLILSLADSSALRTDQESTATEPDRAFPLSKFKGFPVVLFLLGIDCGTCKHIAESLSYLQEKYSWEARFVGICVQFGCGERLAEFRPAVQGRFPLGYCRTRDLCSALRIPKATWLFYPTMIFLDQNQSLRGLFIGRDEFFKDVVANTCEVLDGLLLEDEVREDCMEVGV